MPTVVTKTVKTSGGDYATLGAAEAANANLVSLDQQWDIVCDNFEDTALCIFNGWTTDATRFIRIKAANPHGSFGRITTNSYRIKHANNAFTAQAIGGAGGFMVLEGIQFLCDGGGYCIRCDCPGKFRFINCVIYGGPTAGCQGVQATLNQSATMEFINCTFICNHNCIARTWGNFYLYGCTFITTTASLAAVALGSGAEARVLKNCYAYCVGGGGKVGFEGFATATMSGCISADATSGNIVSKPFSTANFLNVTGGSEDLRPSAASALRAAGASRAGDIAPFNYTTDIAGVLRPIIGDDVGPFQVSAAGGSSGKTFFALM